LSDEKNSDCKQAPQSSANGFVDLRDLLLSQTEAFRLGGNGRSPYGSLFRSAMKIVQDELLAVDSRTGLSRLNSVLIDPLTEEQSGVAGRFAFKEPVLDSGTNINVGGLNAKVQLKASDLYFEALNSVGEPLRLLSPVQNQSDLLDNTIGIGTSDPLRVGLRFLFALLGDGTYGPTRWVLVICRVSHLHYTPRFRDGDKK
jgi:hypothetical protein